MTQTRALPLVLEVLDDGLRLYRRYFAEFLLVSTAVLVVLALLALSFMTFVRTQIGTSEGWLLLAIAMLFVLGYPFMLYALAALSRAAGTALDQQPISVLHALRLNPIRGCGMVVFNMLFGAITAVVLGTMGTVLSCSLGYSSILGVALFDATSNSVISSVLLSLFGVVSQVSLLWSVTMFGAWLASIVYALQAFVLEQRRWSEAAGRSLDLVTARFGHSLLMFIGAGAIFSTLSISYGGALLVLIAVVQDTFNLELPPLIVDAAVISLAVASLVVLLPPLAIWMATFYRRMACERDAIDMTQRVATWRAQLHAQ